MKKDDRISKAICKIMELKKDPYIMPFTLIVEVADILEDFYNKSYEDGYMDSVKMEFKDIINE